MITPEFFTPKQAAQFTGYSVKALEALRARNKGPRYYKPDGRSIRYRVDDLRAWLTGGGDSL